MSREMAPRMHAWTRIPHFLVYETIYRMKFSQETKWHYAGMTYDRGVTISSRGKYEKPSGILLIGLLMIALGYSEYGKSCLLL